jgi:hypothetical protein
VGIDVPPAATFLIYIVYMYYSSINSRMLLGIFQQGRMRRPAPGEDGKVAEPGERGSLGLLENILCRFVLGFPAGGRVLSESSPLSIS